MTSPETSEAEVDAANEVFLDRCNIMISIDIIRAALTAAAQVRAQAHEAFCREIAEKLSPPKS